MSEEQLHQVASLHGRSLQAPVRVDLASPPRVLSERPSLPVLAHAGESASPAGMFPTASGPDAELTQQLVSFASRLDALQEQIAQLALALLNERERSVDQRISTLESLLLPLMRRQIWKRIIVIGGCKFG